MIELFHTSPDAVIVPHSYGTFGEFLFFSATPYVTTASTAYVYSVSVASERIVAASSLWYVAGSNETCAEIITDVMAMCGVDEDTACDLLDESVSIYDIESEVEPEDLADMSWTIQKLTAQCAKLLGCIGVEVTDEQGTAYMLDVTAINLVNMGEAK